MNTDTERLNFLQLQRITRWVGYSHRSGGSTVWPVFPGDNLRDEIDVAMRESARDSAVEAKAQP